MATVTAFETHRHFLGVVRLDLEDLLVKRGGLGQEALGEQVIGDLLVLRRRHVRLVGAYVEVAERIARVPVARLVLHHAHVLRDGEIEAALTEQLLGFLERFCAVDGQRKA